MSQTIMTAVKWLVRFVTRGIYIVNKRPPSNAILLMKNIVHILQYNTLNIVKIMAYIFIFTVTVDYIIFKLLILEF